MFGKRGELFSDSVELGIEYERDVARLSGAQSSEIQYLLQPGSGGKHECLVDVFAALTGGPCNGNSRRILDPFLEMTSLILKRNLSRTSPPIGLRGSHFGVGLQIAELGSSRGRLAVISGACG